MAILLIDVPFLPSCTVVFCSRALRKDQRASQIRGFACSSTPCSVDEPSSASEAVARLVAFVEDEASSFLGQATWEEVMEHTAERLKWVNPDFDMFVVNEKFLLHGPTADVETKRIDQADIWIIIGVRNVEAVGWICNKSGNIQNVICFDASPELRNKLNGIYVPDRNVLTGLLTSFSGGDLKETLLTMSLVEEAWSRRNSDDIRFMLLVLIDRYVTPVESLKNLRAQDLSTLKCMIKNCSSQILACLSNSNCRKAIICLNNCAPTDQVCSYRCIASYECSELEAFSLCVLQKHNCLGLSAEIPSQPDVKPMEVFRGVPITHSIAEDIFVGWLEKLEWSWRVVAGQNPAYDQFPCQFQIFYRGAARGSLWYVPVFRIKTLDGRLIWRKRRYRVRRGETAGTFHFSVLDNGVVSQEYWRIVDVPDDLSWGLFFYSGAAAAAGQSYTGAVLVTPDGQWPPESEEKRVLAALDRCGIKSWELYNVNNAYCEGPPLELPKDVPRQRTSLWSEGTNITA
ncbi:hypothetical protein KP509_25G007800 [Ceratopteris richardii]|uniref:VDE lipocalin domain-containing protein n=1 Tax=Ceratopteris richardii TaxID=49495 RepID=A0A8T2RNX1_CERRI|nr:hypothetical protein KP509_25G007800 [Ceratopteris richardii]